MWATHTLCGFGALAVLSTVRVHALPSYREKLPMGALVACPPGVVGCSTGAPEMNEPPSVCRGIGQCPVLWRVPLQRRVNVLLRRLSFGTTDSPLIYIYIYI